MQPLLSNDKGNKMYPIIIGSKNNPKITFKTQNSLLAFKKKELSIWEKHLNRTHKTIQFVNNTCHILTNITEATTENAIIDYLQLESFIISTSLEGKFLLTEIELVINSNNIYKIDSLNNIFSLLQSSGENNRRNFTMYEGYIFNTIKFLQTRNRIVKIQNHDDYLRSVIEEYDAQLIEKKEKISETEKEFNSKFSSLYNEFKDEFDNLFEARNEQINDQNDTYNNLVNLFEAKMRLKGPSTYWYNYSREYEKKGNIWIGMALTIGLITCVISYIYLANFDTIFPKSITNFNTIKNIIDTIKWIIVLAITPTIGFYFIKLCIKFANSNYHLSMDAKERLNLTHYYLSLKFKDNFKDNEDLEKIIFQSLFGRAETGLLKGDSSPILPSSILSELSKILGK